MFRAFLFLTAVVTTVTAADRPNIVLILADDVGREVLGCYGGTSYSTPHIDRLASEGALFEHCYSMPVCHPTRLTLLTGRYPRHLPQASWGGFPRSAEPQTFAQVARRAGYATAVAGKWQLCLLKKDPDHPKRLGFDEWSLFGWHEGPRYHSPLIYENGELKQDTDGKYGPDLYVDFLKDFIRRNRSGPFLAFYSMALCHDVTDDIGHPVPYGEHGRYDNYAEMVEKMDHQVGRLVQSIDELGLREDTLILFTTDNGTAARSKLEALDDSGKRFRYEDVVSTWNGQQIPGGKGKLTDWGTRVPGIARWPGHVAPGSRRDDLIDFSDILPTIADLVEGEPPANVQLDGVSIASLLTDAQPSTRQWVYAESRNGRFFTRSRRWKLYDHGRFFDALHDSFEQHPIPLSELPADAESDYQLLNTAIEMLKKE